MSAGNKNPHSSTKHFCKNCGTELKSDGLFCPDCAEVCSTLSEEFENELILPTEENTLNESDDANINNIESSSDSNAICLFSLIMCVFLWFAAPFIAVNLLTFGDQPTAFQLVTGDVLVLGNIKQSFMYWAAVISIVGIIVCIISKIAGANQITRITAIVAEISMAFALFESLNWFSHFDDFFDVFDVIGFGFWGIFILLFLVIITSGSTNENRSNSAQEE